MNKSSLKAQIKRKIPSKILPLLQWLHAKLLQWRSYISYAIHCYFGDFHIKVLVLVVGQACNYRCRDCANFCPISPKEYKRYSLESMTSSLKSIFENVNYIETLQIQGGEPFIYSDLGGGTGLYW